MSSSTAQAAARFGVRVQDIDNALNNAFSQRQISTIYGPRNQYRVILEVDRKYQRDPNDLTHVYVPGTGGAQVPLSAVAHIERGIAPLVVNHQGQFPSVTITYNLAPDTAIEDATAALEQAVAEMHMPDIIHADFAGDVKAFKQAVGAQPLLLLAALIAVYIVLGVLYESLAHPLTIISTLPSAGLGALLALKVSGTELSVIAFIGIILLIGIVKKNGIMMVDFALDGERRLGLSPQRAIHEACLERFRPILMTTLAAMLGAVPLVIAIGPGSELRRPLGITIIGGLLVSQVLTLYTTPVIYLLLDRLHRRLGGASFTFVRPPRPAAAAGGVESHPQIPMLHVRAPRPARATSRSTPRGRARSGNAGRRRAVSAPTFLSITRIARPAPSAAPGSARSRRGSAAPDLRSPRRGSAGADWSSARGRSPASAARRPTADCPCCRRARPGAGTARRPCQVSRSSPSRLTAVANRFSRTDRLGKICRPSGTRPMPSWATLV